MQGCALAVLVVDCHQWTEMTQDMRATDQGWWLKKKVEYCHRFSQIAFANFRCVWLSTTRFCTLSKTQGLAPDP